MSLFKQAVGLGWGSGAEGNWLCPFCWHALLHCAHGHNQALDGSAAFTEKSSVP